MAKWLASWTPNHKIVGSSPTKATWLIKNHPAWATGDDLSSLSQKWVPGNRQTWQLYLNYPWHLEACERLYTPQGVEQVMHVTGLLRVIICKAFWTRFIQEKRYIRTAYYYFDNMVSKNSTLYLMTKSIKIPLWQRFETLARFETFTLTLHME